VLPGALVIAVLALGYAQFGALPLVQAAFLGIKAAVIVIVVQAILRLLGRALGRPDHRVIALLAFAALFAFNLSFPLVIGLAAAYGAWACTDHTTVKKSLPWRQSMAPVVIGGALWAAPLIWAWAAGATFLLALGLFFSKLAVVTFGGAYAVLAYMTQAVVTDYGWLTTAEMIDALGLAETTPGPLILVTQFAGILAGINAGGWGLGALAGLVTLWVTFVPCFIWIFAGAPLIDWLDGTPRIRAALAAVTAAVVGVIANLSVWFAAHVMFAQMGRLEAGPLRVLTPDWASFDPVAALLTLLAGALLLWQRLPLPLVLLMMAAAGIAAAEIA